MRSVGLQEIVARLGRLKQIMQNSKPVDKQLPTPFGLLAPPLGTARLKAVELVAALVHTGDPVAEQGTPVQITPIYPECSCPSEIASDASQHLSALISCLPIPEVALIPCHNALPSGLSTDRFEVVFLHPKHGSILQCLEICSETALQNQSSEL